MEYSVSNFIEKITPLLRDLENNFEHNNDKYIQESFIPTYTEIPLTTLTLGAESFSELAKNLNLEDNAGHNLVHYMSLDKNPELLKMIIAYSKQLGFTSKDFWNKKDNYGKTAINYAIENSIPAYYILLDHELVDIDSRTLSYFQETYMDKNFKENKLVNLQNHGDLIYLTYHKKIKQNLKSDIKPYNNPRQRDLKKFLFLYTDLQITSKNIINIIQTTQPKLYQVTAAIITKYIFGDNVINQMEKQNWHIKYDCPNFFNANDYDILSKQIIQGEVANNHIIFPHPKKSIPRNIIKLKKQSSKTSRIYANTDLNKGENLKTASLECNPTSMPEHISNHNLNIASDDASHYISQQNLALAGTENIQNNENVNHENHFHGYEIDMSGLYNIITKTNLFTHTMDTLTSGVRYYFFPTKDNAVSLFIKGVEMVVLYEGYYSYNVIINIINLLDQISNKDYTAASISVMNTVSFATFPLLSCKTQAIVLSIDTAFTAYKVAKDIFLLREDIQDLYAIDQGKQDVAGETCTESPSWHGEI